VHLNHSVTGSCACRSHWKPACTSLDNCRSAQPNFARSACLATGCFTRYMGWAQCMRPGCWQIHKSTPKP
jgi:hypothetical protein